MLSDKTRAFGAPAIIKNHGDGDGGDYSLKRALECAMTGRSEGLEGELAQEAGRPAKAGYIHIPYTAVPRTATAKKRALEVTALQAQTDGHGVAESVFDESMIIQRLFSKTAILSFCSILPMQLNQDYSVPIESGANTVTWATEKGTRAASASHIEFGGNLKWTWHEATAQIEITRQFFDQTQNIENRIYKSLSEDLPREIESRILNGTATNSIAGIPSLSGISTVKLGASANAGGVPTYQKLIKLNTEIQRANAGDLGNIKYVTNHKIGGYLRSTKKFDSSGADTTIAMVMNGKLYIDGVEVCLTNLMDENLAVGTDTTAAASRIICCIPSEIMIGYFSGYEVLVDPFSNKNSGQIDIQIRQSMDVKYAHTAAFSMAADAVIS